MTDAKGTVPRITEIPLLDFVDSGLSPKQTSYCSFTSAATHRQWRLATARPLAQARPHLLVRGLIPVITENL